MLFNFLRSLALSAAVATALPTYFPSETPDTPLCDCTGTNSSGGGSASKDYICGDPRLGPVVLPTKLPLDNLVEMYNRFGGLTPGEYLKRWWKDEGGYVYPDQSGFQLDQQNQAINGTMILQIGALVDRFGHEGGKFLAPAGTPYSQRAMPPVNLNTNPSAPEFPLQYHVYRVMRPLTVVGGPIAPWFGQPGLGTQFHTGGVGNIATLLKDGYLKEQDASALVPKEEVCL